MSTWTSPVRPADVLIAGGGIAGVEALMALADLGDRRLRVELLSPRETFVLRPADGGGAVGRRPAPRGPRGGVRRLRRDVPPRDARGGGRRGPGRDHA